MPLRHPALLSVLAIALPLLSCTSDDSSPAGPPGGGEDKAVTATIDAAGGSVSAVANGATIKLTFPPDAVAGPVEITLRPVEATTRSRFGMQLEPLGRVFDEDVLVEVELPDSAELEDLLLFLGDAADPWYFPTDVDSPSRTIRGSIRFFGLDFQALKTGTPNQLGATAVDCDALIATLKTRFGSYVAAGDYLEAVKLAKTIAATLNKAGCLDAVRDWVQIAEDTACDGLAAAITHAQNTPTANFGNFAEQVMPMIEFDAIIQELNIGSSCAASADLDVAMDTEIAEWLTLFFLPRVDGLQDGDWSTFMDLKEEALRAREMSSAASALGRHDMSDEIETDGFEPAVDRMRQIAYSLCDGDGWHYPLSRLTSAGFFAPRDIVGVAPRFPSSAQNPYANFSDDEIHEDLQYCGTHVRFVSVTAGGGEFKVVEGGGDGAPGLSTSEIYLDTATRGTLRIAGTIPAFVCWNDIEADHELVLRYNAQDVLVLEKPTGNPDYFENDDWNIPIETIVAKTGVTPSGGNSQFFKVMRRRSDCDQRAWGPEEFFLFDLTLNWVNPDAETTVDLPSNVQPGETVDVSVCVKVIDQLGQAGFFEAIDVVLQAAGGTLQQPSGQTDAQGCFRTKLTVDGSNATKAGQVQVDATATLFEGVTASNSATASVGPAGTANILYLSHTGDVRLYGMESVKRITGEYIDPASPGGWTWSASADADSSANGQSYSASGSANVNTTLSLSGDQLLSFGGSLSTQMQLSASGDFALNRTPSAVAQIELGIQFEVVGGNVPYTLSGSASVSGDYLTWVELSGGPDVIGFYADYPDVPPGSFDQSGFLEPGTYWIQVFGESFDTCTNCTVSGTTNIGWSLSLGPN